MEHAFRRPGPDATGRRASLSRGHPREEDDGSGLERQEALPKSDPFRMPAKDKRHVVLEAGHVPPNDVLTQEVLVWLDRYLGPTG